MRRTLSLIAACFLLAAGALSVQATVKPATAQAWVFGGSCGWRTDPSPNYWWWSPAYGEYYHYEGHQLINGHNYRSFWVYNPYSGIYQRNYVYCG